VWAAVLNNIPLIAVRVLLAMAETLLLSWLQIYLNIKLLLGCLASLIMLSFL